MKKIQSKFSATLVFALVAAAASFGVSTANAAPIDVSYLQTCLKVEGSSLDVLVLMDSSASLRNSTKDDSWYPKYKAGSDPEKMRGKILTSSLKILRSLAQESDRAFNISLRNFGNNSNPKELKNLQSHWQDWSAKTSDADLSKFVDHALYDESTMTEWTNGLITAKNQFKQRIGQAELAGTKSCPIMFWITDGAATDSTDPICVENTNASISWFRENNVLVLGGLLQPKDDKYRVDPREFQSIVTGENCGRYEEEWTRGEVIEANDVSDLAWGFIGLIASIKNLVNLNSDDSTFYVDPSTSHIEISIRGDQKTWQVIQPDGKIFCSSSNRGENCTVSPPDEIGITTIVIYPERPTDADGTWEVSPKFSDESMQVYGGLDSSGPIPRAKQAKLLINPKSAEVDEGKDISFEAKLVNADGSPFSLDGFKTISICAKVDSAKNSKCNNGSTSTSLSVSPTTSDKSVAFEAILVSARGESSREYRIVASARINVIPSGAFPSLICEEDPCELTSLANKNKEAVSNLRVVPAKNGSSAGRVSVIGFTVLSDNVENRGDGNFEFRLQKVIGSDIDSNSQGEYLSPGDEIRLTVSTDIAGDSEIQGVIKYKVFSDGKEIVRQLPYKFEVGSKKNFPLQIALVLLAYLLTVGLPYLYLLWSARRAAVLNVPGDDYSFLSLPFEITNDGRLKGVGELPTGVTFAPDYTKLEKRTLDSGSKEVFLDKVKVSVIPPKWNPFTPAKTKAEFSEGYLISTASHEGIAFQNVSFVSSLIDEVIVYFPEEGNITAVKPVSNEAIVDDIGLSFRDSAYENKITEGLSEPTGPVTGDVLFIVSPYVNNNTGLNREKSLLAAVAKLNATVEGLNFSEDIANLRAGALKDALAREEAEKVQEKAEQEKEDKKGTGKKGKKNADKTAVSDISSGSSDDDWGGGSTSNGTSKDSPESGKSSGSWD
jgi:hypothetical protein